MSGPSRRIVLGGALAALATLARAQADHPQRQFQEAADAQRRKADAARDQSYGAVLVFNDVVVGEGPSRVMESGDAWAHAEREAIRDAQRRLGKVELPGAVLYSTSPPCPQCRLVAAQARVSRMYFGASMADGGMP